MSGLRYLNLVERVLTGMKSRYPALGDPERRMDLGSRLINVYSPALSDMENRANLTREAEVMLNEETKGSAADRQAQPREFYAVNILRLRSGAVVDVLTIYVACVENTVVSEIEARLIAEYVDKETPTPYGTTRALSVSVDFHELPDDCEIRFYVKTAGDIQEEARRSAKAIREKLPSDL